MADRSLPPFGNSIVIGEFRIPGRPGSSERERANAGENGRIDRDARDICVFKMPKHNCCAYKCSTSEQKKRQTEKYPELASQNR